MKMVQVMKTLVVMMTAVLCLSQMSDCCNLGTEEMTCQDGNKTLVPLKEHIGCEEQRKNLCRTVEPQQEAIAFDNCGQSHQAICDTKKEGLHNYSCTEAMTYEQAVTVCQQRGGNLAEVCPREKETIKSFRKYCNTPHIWVNNGTAGIESGAGDLKVCSMSVLLLVLLGNWLSLRLVLQEDVIFK